MHAVLLHHAEMPIASCNALDDSSMLAAGNDCDEPRELLLPLANALHVLPTSRIIVVCSARYSTGSCLHFPS